MVHHSNGCGWLACLLGGSAVVSALVFSVTGKKGRKNKPGDDGGDDERDGTGPAHVPRWRRWMTRP